MLHIVSRSTSLFSDWLVQRCLALCTFHTSPLQNDPLPSRLSAPYLQHQAAPFRCVALAEKGEHSVTL
ncbi:hypothetical protein RJT34_25128 [Clitoria ternatea]|uniref:Uncharacterized protein n=1 Tax=Clitoria ternatea TaxID=43366 RepID=A0AAN9FS01_CLITE